MSGVIRRWRWRRTRRTGEQAGTGMGVSGSGSGRHRRARRTLGSVVGMRPRGRRTERRRRRLEETREAFLGGLQVRALFALGGVGGERVLATATERLCARHEFAGGVLLGEGGGNGSGGRHSADREGRAAGMGLRTRRARGHRS